jgi:hypothetical protein
MMIEEGVEEEISAGAPLSSQGAGTVADTEASRKITKKCFVSRNVGVYRKM